MSLIIRSKLLQNVYICAKISNAKIYKNVNTWQILAVIFCVKHANVNLYLKRLYIS